MPLSSSVGTNWRARPRFAVSAAIFLAQAVIATLAWSADLVDLKLDSSTRQFTPDNPVQHAEQQFSINGPGILTVEWFTDPHQGANGGHSIAAEDGSPLYLGREVFREETPKPLVVGSPYRLKYVIVVPKATQPLEASLTAWWAPQAIQVWNYGDQLGSSQRLKISFVPVDQAVAQAGSPPEVDISGVWRQGNAGQTWSFTPRGDGFYDAVETGYGNARGTARLSGRTISLSFTNTSKYGNYTSGIWIAQVDASGQTATAGWLTDDGDTGTFTWTRQTPTIPEPSQPPVETGTPPSQPVGAVSAKQVDWEAAAVDLRGQNGKQFAFVCPAGGVPSVHLWGTDLYTDDSSVCTAAAHAGVITQQSGGAVTIEIRAGAESYAGSQRNRITSQSWGPHSGSFMFAVTSPGPKPTADMRTYKVVNYWKEKSYQHVYEVDVANCTVAEPAVVGTAQELTGSNFSLCSKDERLSFAITDKNGYAVEYDWVLGDGGSVVNGAYKDSASRWGPSFGNRVK